MSTISESIVLAENLSMRYHAETHLGGFDACPRCEPDRELIATARAELGVHLPREFTALKSEASAISPRRVSAPKRKAKKGPRRAK